MSEDLQTINPDQVPVVSAVSADGFVFVQAPGGPIQKVPYSSFLVKLIAADLLKSDEAALQGDLAHAEHVVALVDNDPDPLKCGWYRKVGAVDTGNWLQFEQLTKAVFEAVQAAQAALSGAVDDIAYLMYRDTGGVSIDSFTADPAIGEVGATIAVDLDWTISGTITGQTLADSEDGAIALVDPVADRAASQAGVDGARTFTLSVQNADAPGSVDEKVATVAVSFANKGHAGTINKSDGATLTSGEVNGMSQAWWATGIDRSLSFTTGADGCLWYSQPASLADPSAFKVGGFVIAAEKTTRNHTTATGQVVSYNDFRLSDLVPAGTAILIEVIA